MTQRDLTVLRLATSSYRGQPCRCVRAGCHSGSRCRALASLATRAAAPELKIVRHHRVPESSALIHGKSIGLDYLVWRIEQRIASLQAKGSRSRESNRLPGYHM